MVTHIGFELGKKAEILHAKSWEDFLLRITNSSW